ncbi:MAG: exo-alpha-sialidase [Candidatus Omnitrophica bacterium]|nr:exo-alpha-sialidase [Candidatus Omnitrophota bacterium]
MAILIDVLESEDPHGHVHACESLYKVNEIGDGEAIRRAFEETENDSLRLMAAAALARWGNPSALESIREQVESGDENVARISAWILGRIGDSSDIPRLKKRLEGLEDKLAIAFFEHSLARLVDREGREALTENLSDSDPAIRTYAAVFAGESGMVSTKDRLIELLEDENLDTRIRAAQALLVLSSSEPIEDSDNFSVEVYPATEKNPRYSEGSIIQLRDGRLLYATTEFFESNSDFAKARIVARESTDGGRTWSESRVLQENVGDKNVMSVTLRRLKNPVWGCPPIGLFYLVKNSMTDLQVFLRISEDEGQTLGDPIQVSVGPGYHVMNNDRVTLLSTGRLLAPVATTEDVAKVNHFVSHCFYSDDAGQTWKASSNQVDYAQRGAMEPEVIELENGRVLMIFRTQLGHIGASYSEDGGETWSEGESFGVVAPESPATLRRIPSTGNLLLIWNDNYTEGAGHSGKRNPLTAAISRDEGKTWTHKRNMENDPNETYSYTSLDFANGRALLSYYVADEESGWISSRFRSVPIGWFYEGE